MKKVIIALIAILSFFTVGLIIFLIFAINRHVDVISFDNSNVKLVNTQNVSLENINSINLEFSYDDVIFYTSETKELILKEYKNFTPEDNQLAKITTKGQDLLIRGVWQNQLFWMFNRYSRIEIYLPAEYADELTVSTSSGDISSDLVFKLSKLKLSSTSGDIMMNEIYAEEINVSASSGDVTLQKAEGNRQISSTSGDILVNGGNGDSNVNASSGNVTIKNALGKLEADTTSGDINIMASNGDKIIEASSGDITVENSSGPVQVGASSGDIKITASKGGGTIRTTSGEIQFELEEVTDNIDITASSGDVTLKLPSTTNIDFTADTSSGDIKTFFDDQLSFNKELKHASGTIGENPTVSVKVTTTSGEIYVKEN